MEGVPAAQNEDSRPQGSGINDAQKEAGAGSPYSADFYIYSFKIVPCTASYAHNWSLCPFVHPNEKARRRDPRIHSYEPLPCPFDKKGANCPHGDACQYTHNIYEYWLHPKRFRTQMCQQGAACRRPLCFFAHNLQELRFAEGQLQRGSVLPEPTAALAAGAAGMAGLADARMQQASAAAAATLGAGAYMPALVPYALVAGADGTSITHVQGAGGTLPVGLAGASLAHAQALAAAHSPQQQGWVPGFVMPQGFVVLNNPPSPFMPAAAMSGDLDAQQQQYLPTLGGQLQPARLAQGPSVSATAAAAAAAVAAVAACRPMAGEAAGYGGLHFDSTLDPALMSPQYQVVPDDQVLLSQAAGLPGGDSSSSFAALQHHHHQQQQQDAAAAAVASGSNYSWCLNPMAPSTTSASVSMSLLSVPTMGMSSSASVPGSSNNSLSHIRQGQPGASVSLDVLQARMQQLGTRDCHVRDL